VPEYLPLPRFHLPLIEPGVRICRTRLSDGMREVGTQGGRRHHPFTGPLVRSADPDPHGGDRQHGHSPDRHGFRNTPEVRPLPSTGVTRLRRYYGPVRLPRRPGLSLAGVPLAKRSCHRLGSPVLRAFSLCRHASATTPAGPSQGSGCSPESDDGGLPQMTAGSAPASKPFRGLLGVHARSGLPARGVALSDPFHRRLRQYRYLHRRSDCYWLEQQLPGGNCTH
jgi:hypothetical protein